VTPSSQRPFVHTPGLVSGTVSDSWMPAETVPVVGAPATFDWQLPIGPVPSVPVKL